MINEIVKEIFKSAGIEISRRSADIDAFTKLYDRYADLTMIPFEEFTANLELCKMFSNVKGDYVECGVWKGGMSGAIAEVLGDQRHIHLFDSFQGLPPAKEIDGKEALLWQSNTESVGYFNNCSVDEGFVLKAMLLANHHKYSIYKGWFNETLLTFNHSIAILRLDGDWYDSISICMEKLFPKLMSGGIVIIDDYYTWDGCSKAIHDYLSKVKSPSRVYQWNNRVAYIIKKVA